MYVQTHRAPSAEIPADVMDALMAYRWPGNIRELKNVVERMVLKAGNRPIGFVDLPAEILRGTSLPRTESGMIAPQTDSRR